MNILNEAIESYKAENYAKALKLFEQAGTLYGLSIVMAHIFLCKKALKHPQPEPSGKPTLMTKDTIRHRNGVYVSMPNRLNENDVDQVDDPIDALNQTKLLLGHKRLRPGLTALIRAKNSERFIVQSIASIIDLVDEVVAVENNSTDDTWAVLFNLSKKYSNLRVYKYSIEIPAAGEMHANAVAAGDINTLGTYYNWCLSKVNTSNVLKWDADFIAIRKNLAELIETYNLRESWSNVSIWCTGVTSFNGRFLRIDSYYDEYRVFSNAAGAQWTNYRWCETIMPSVEASTDCYVHGFKNDARALTVDETLLQKKSSKPIFIEIKDSINLKFNAAILDDRDRNDNVYIKKYININPIYDLPSKINDYRVLITIPSLQLGGGNYWAKLLFNQLTFLGIHVDVGVVDSTDQNKILSSQSDIFYDIPLMNLIFLSEETKANIVSYSHILLSYPFTYQDAIADCARVFVFTHSDVSYINEYALTSGYNPVALNDITIEKFGAKNSRCMQLFNYLPHATTVNTKEFDLNDIKILYCNRISQDKNVPMILLALQILIWRFDFAGRIQLTLLAGGSEYSNLEYTTLQSAISKLGLSSCVELLPSQKNTNYHYMSHDFCILASVSEGCSYGLLESINFEVPIITTDIIANNEVTEKVMPVFEFKNLEEINKNSFCINNYYQHIFSLGYIDTDRLDGKGELSYIVKEIYKRVNFEDFKDYNGKATSMFIPYLIPEITDELLRDEYLEYLKKDNLYADLVSRGPEASEDFLKNKCAEIKSDLNEFLEYCEQQTDIFNQGALSIAEAMIDMIENHDIYKNNVIDLKSRLKNKFFSVDNHRVQLCNLLFGEDINFF